MSELPRELRNLITSGPLAHLSTINADGSPQVSVIWIGLDGDDLVSGHMAWHAKLRNIERDPRVVLSFDAAGTRHLLEPLRHRAGSGHCPAKRRRVEPTQPPGEGLYVA
jgi:PPOX class probable F420-dependent enzyme